MWNYLKKKMKVASGAVAGVLGFTSVASAALPLDQQAVVDALTLNLDDMIVVGWALILTWCAFKYGAKILKRVLSAF